jgi:hypothetical protein
MIASGILFRVGLSNLGSWYRLGMRLDGLVCVDKQGFLCGLFIDALLKPARVPCSLPASALWQQ